MRFALGRTYPLAALAVLGFALPDGAGASTLTPIYSFCAVGDCTDGRSRNSR